MVDNYTVNYYINLINNSSSEIDEASLIKKYIKNYYFTIEPKSPIIYKELETEITPSCQHATKLHLVENLPFGFLNLSSFQELSEMKLFTLERQGVMKYYSLAGKYPYNLPTEHTKENFLLLLDTHPDLIELEIIKHMKQHVIHRSMQLEIPNKTLQTKKQKI